MAPEFFWFPATVPCQEKKIDPKTKVKAIQKNYVKQRDFKYLIETSHLSRVHNESYAVYCDGSLGDVCRYNTFSNALRSHVKNLPK